MEDLNALYHSRRNHILKLADIPPQQRWGILPVSFLRARAIEFLNMETGARFHQTEDFTAHFVFYKPFTYNLVDDVNTYVLLTSSEDMTRWNFDIDRTTRIRSGLPLAA